MLLRFFCYYFVSKGSPIKFLFLLVLITINLYAYMSELLSFEDKKASLIQKYELRLETAKIDKLPQRIYLLDKTLKCIENTKSSWEIDSCLDEERKKILDATSYNERNHDINIYKYKKLILTDYLNKINDLDIGNKKNIFVDTYECINKANDYLEIKECKSKEKEKIINLSSR